MCVCVRVRTRACVRARVCRESGGVCLHNPRARHPDSPSFFLDSFLKYWIKGASLRSPDNMRYVAAYLLAALGGNANPSEEDVKHILSSVGIDAEEEKLSKVMSELKVR